MTRSIGTFEAKTHLSDLLEQVEAGESFVITRRGQPVARLVPARPTAPRLTLEQAIDGARALRTQVRADAGKIRDWIGEGRL
jgi:prevent-host-death family protein